MLFVHGVFSVGGNLGLGDIDPVRVHDIRALSSSLLVIVASRSPDLATPLALVVTECGFPVGTGLDLDRAGLVVAEDVTVYLVVLSEGVALDGVTPRCAPRPRRYRKPRCIGI